MLNRRGTGTYYERMAADYLMENGIEIIARNYRCRYGEIDLIGRRKDSAGQVSLIFFEVKFRMSGDFGYAAQAVTAAKQRKICRVSDHYRMMNETPDDIQISYDVVAVDGGRITWIRNAFGYIGRNGGI